MLLLLSVGGWREEAESLTVLESLVSSQQQCTPVFASKHSPLSPLQSFANLMGVNWDLSVGLICVSFINEFEQLFVTLGFFLCKLAIYILSHFPPYWISYLFLIDLQELIVCFEY